ncbi:hypothetical protein BH23BAC3_BH23BAC3_17800 [soil metagenome]
MILRLIYNLWNVLLKTLAYLLVVSIILSGLLLAAIQLQGSKDYIRIQLEEVFNDQFAGTADVESIRGFIPFRTQFNNVTFYSPEYPYSAQLHAEEIYASIDLWGLLTGNITISALELNSPTVLLQQGEEGLLLTGIFKTPDSVKDVMHRRDADRFIQRFTIFAPNISIKDGRLEADHTIIFPDQLGITTPFVVSNLNADFFIESDEEQQFIDINSLTASTNDPDFNEISLSGQFFNDGYYLELNGLDFKTDHSVIQLSAEASPVNFFAENLGDQLTSANYQLDMNRLHIEPAFLHRFNPEFAFISYSIEIEGEAEGNLESLFVDNLQISTGESYVLADGRIRDLAGPGFRYDLVVSNMIIDENELTPLLSELDAEHIDLSSYGTPILRGELRGSLHDVNGDLTLQTDQGATSIDGKFVFAENSYDLFLDLDSLDVSPFFSDSLGTTILFGQINATGRGLDRTATIESSFNLSDSRILDHTFNLFVADLNLANRTGTYSVQLRNEDTEGSGSGSFLLGDNRQQFSTEAVIQSLDITTYFPNLAYESTNFSGRISANIEGASINDVFGRLSVEVNESIIDGDTLRPHQFYADINERSGDSRTLRMTSSFFDADLTGSIYPEKLSESAAYWHAFLAERINEELFFEEPVTVPSRPDQFPVLADGAPVDLSLRATVKDLELFRAYFPDLQEIESSATFNLNINATSEVLSLNASFFDDSLTVNNSSFNDLGLSINGVFNHGEMLRSNSLIDFQINSPDLVLNNNYRIDGASINASLRDSVISIRQEIENALENLTFYAEATTIWHNDRFLTTVDTLTTGSSDYRWKALGSPTIEYSQKGSVTFNQFTLESEDDFFEMDGTFSNAPEDSVNYNIRNFSLARVSDMIGGRIQFEGIVDGDFTTRALTQIPSIQGDIMVTEGRLNNRVIGDVSLRSRYNAEDDRFDTDIQIYTDPDRYADYLEANNGVGQDLYFSGYFKTPDDADDDDDLYFFEADLREIDMWIVTAIIPNIVTAMEGNSSGTGFIRGSRNDYDYEAVFEIEDVYGRPAFTNVPYTLNGSLVFNRSDGLLFQNITLDDRRGGRGTLSGQVDLRDFDPLTIFDLRIELNNLRFMNSVEDPNVPFIADLYGSGRAVFEGTSAAPVIRSISPILLSSASRISIPLRAETELDQDRQFIQFVESFEDLTPLQRRNGRGENGLRNGAEEEVDLTFLELFTMNLQFVTNDPISVQLIFDPVTNDILTATGTGQISLILDDQNLSMYGRFNIESGEYQFVGGDIFTRRFNIQEGGSISWQGDLANANLNVTASYRARPDISTLLRTGTSFQRVPIELVLQIGGTISEITNEFYFQVPTGIEGTQDPTIAAQINRLNQNEDEKVLQAFGILLTGNFVPSDELQNPEFGNVTGTNALVNPLVSSQIISPLLSNQINTLLRSDITLDVDFNLNAFNEVDLGVALRLFNDRIVLRREGQITGETEIGDIGATYRINRTFSVTAFHRQDPTLSNRAETEARQTQEMNGMGVEAQFQFNTWQSLKNRISNSFRNLFGLKQKEPDVEDEESDSLAGS